MEKFVNSSSDEEDYYTLPYTSLVDSNHFTYTKKYFDYNKTQQLKEAIENVYAFYIKQYKIKSDLKCFLKNRNENVDCISKEMKHLRKKFTRLANVFHLVEVAYGNDARHALELSLDDILMPLETYQITFKEMLEFQKINCYCFVHKEVFCSCLNYLIKF